VGWGAGGGEVGRGSGAWQIRGGFGYECGFEYEYECECEYECEGEGEGQCEGELGVRMRVQKVEGRGSIGA
jgi:hypothetical protein